MSPFSLKSDLLTASFSRHVKGLVGELDFSFHAVSTTESMAPSRMASRAGSRVDLSDMPGSKTGDRDKTD
jgi:hypothetical protein